jgi:cyanophycinase
MLQVLAMEASQFNSPEALANPYGNKVTLSRSFLDIPLLHAVITDTHFAKRDRMGRLLVFLARILQDGWAKRVRAVAVEENAAVLIEADGRAKSRGLRTSLLSLRRGSTKDLR